MVEGGAEKVCREILGLYPEADVFSLIDFLNDEDRKRILHGKKSSVSVIQKFPRARRNYRMYLPFFPAAIERFDLSKYDLIISSSYSVAKSVLTHANQTHICYCHSPMRYAWDLTHEYLNQMYSPLGIKRALARFFLRRIRIWDVTSSNRVDLFLTNSKNVQNRIKKIYRRESEILHPPVDVDDFLLQPVKSDYYITASRIVEYKRIDLIVQSFKDMPEKNLVVCGDGPGLSDIRKMAHSAPNIEISGYLPKTELVQKIASAKAFIMAAHEDFGIAPVEALACGTPVIGYAKGGILETVEENKTGVFFNEQTSTSLIDAIEKFENSHLLSPEEIRNSALRYSRENFVNRFREIVEKNTTQ